MDNRLAVFVALLRIDGFDLIQHGFQRRADCVDLALHQRVTNEPQARVLAQVVERAAQLCHANIARRRMQAVDVVDLTTAQRAVDKDMAWRFGRRVDGFGHDDGIAGLRFPE